MARKIWEKVRGKRGKKTTQNPKCIELDSDNEDKKMATSLLLQTKDAQIKEIERDFGMEKYIIQHYKSELNVFKKIKRGLALRKKMTKHYAKKNKLACAKLKEALIEVKKT